MINFETVTYYDEDNIEYTESEMRLKSLLREIDNHIGCSNDYEGIVDERELSFDEIKLIVIQSLNRIVIDILSVGFKADEVTDMREYCKFIERVAKQ